MSEHEILVTRCAEQTDHAPHDQNSVIFGAWHCPGRGAEAEPYTAEQEAAGNIRWADLMVAVGYEDPAEDVGEGTMRQQQVIPMAEHGIEHLQAGDIVLDLAKRDRNPASSWSYTLVAQAWDSSTTPSGAAHTLSWLAIYGPGTHGGKQTRISGPQRLSRMHYVGNIKQGPFRIELPEEKAL